MPGEPLPDCRRRTVEFERDQPRVVVKTTSDSRLQGTEDKTIAGLHGGWQRPVLGAHPKVAEPEEHRRKRRDAVDVERLASREAHFDTTS